MNKDKDIIRENLFNLGCMPHLNGFEYLVECIYIIKKYPNKKFKLYELVNCIADKFKVNKEYANRNMSYALRLSSFKNSQVMEFLYSYDFLIKKLPNNEK